MRWYKLLWVLHRKKMIVGAVLFLIFAVIGLTFLPLEKGSQSPSAEEPKEFEDEYLYYPLSVKQIPDGYISWDTVETEVTFGSVRYDFLETYFFLSDYKGDLLVSGPVWDGKLVIEYEGEYYMNGEVFRSAVEQSEQTAAQQASPYQIGEEVRLRRNYEQYNVVIKGVEGQYIHAVLKQAGKPETVGFSLLPYLVRVVTKNGQSIATFSEAENGSVSVHLSPGDEIARIILKNPDRPSVKRTVIVFDEP